MLFTVTAAYPHAVLYAYEAVLRALPLLLVVAAARDLRVHGNVRSPGRARAGPAIGQRAHALAAPSAT